MKTRILIFILLGLIGFTVGVRACPYVGTFPVKGLYYGSFPVYVSMGDSWDVEWVLNAWEERINYWAGYNYNRFVTDYLFAPGFVANYYSPRVGPNEVAKTRIRTDPKSGQINSFEIYYNDSTYTNWCFGEPESCPYGYISFRAVMAHEVGHGIGLDHADFVCSCAAFKALTLNEKKEQFPTMTPTTDGACLSYGFFQPYMLLHTISGADDWAVKNIYAGVVSVEEPFEYAEIRNNKLTIKMNCEELDVKPASLYISNNKDGPVEALPGNPYNVTKEGSLCGFRASLPSSSSPSWAWYRFEGESTTKGPFEIRTEDKSPDANSLNLSVSPNPFNSSTEITYTLSKPGKIKITIYNLKGQRVAEVENESRAAGQYSVTWDAKGKGGKALPSGTYFARLQGESVYKTCKLVLAK